MRVLRRAGALLGLAVGDALGMPFEMMRAGADVLVDWDGEMAPGDRLPLIGPPLPAGYWTDDTAMALCIAESLAANGLKYEGKDVSRRYLEWYKHGNTGMGKSTRAAMVRLEGGRSWTNSGVNSLDFNPNQVGPGSVMRCAPLAYAKGNLAEIIAADARITHLDYEATAGGMVVVRAVWEALNNAPLPAVPRPDKSLVAAKLAYGRDLIQFGSLPPDSVFSLLGTRGDAASIVATADYCCSIANSFEEGVQLAVRAGGDTDTRAAVVGAVLGARYGIGGEQGIPERWIDILHDAERIQELEMRLVRG